MYGWRSMNVPFAVWLSQLRLAPIWLMFHEVAFPWGWSRPLRHSFLGAVHRLMAWLIVRRAERIFVSTPSWEPTLLPMLPRGSRIEWLPIPSNLPLTADPDGAAAVRSDAAPGGEILLGHFGTYGASIAPLLAELLPPLLAVPGRRMLLLGRNSQDFAGTIRREYPDLRTGIVVQGEQPPTAAANCLAACDLLVQPFPDGVSSRRTSLMAGLALGVPIATNRGHLTEPVWERSRAVLLVRDATPVAYLPEVEATLASPIERQRLGRAGKALYNQWFGLNHTVTALRGAANVSAVDSLGPL
jgi:hypothetical protein